MGIPETVGLPVGNPVRDFCGRTKLSHFSMTAMSLEGCAALGPDWRRPFQWSTVVVSRARMYTANGIVSSAI